MALVNPVVSALIPIDTSAYLLLLAKRVSYKSDNGTLSE